MESNNKDNDILLAGVRLATAYRREPVFNEKGLSTGKQFLVKTKLITVISSSSYWSSTEDSDNYAFGVVFRLGNVYNLSKNSNSYSLRFSFAFWSYLSIKEFIYLKRFTREAGRKYLLKWLYLKIYLCIGIVYACWTNLFRSHKAFLAFPGMASGAGGIESGYAVIDL